MWIEYSLSASSFLMAAIFFCFERFTMKKYEDLKVANYEKIEDLELLSPIIRRYALLNLFSLFVACGSLLFGLYLIMSIIVD